jgi:type II secretory ATPase GspE/PulE/Tfp pilus assembly ATPase PilB-like protein
MEKELLYLNVDWSTAEVFQGKGCDNCNHTGYQGRLGVYELLVTSDNLGTMVMSGESTGDLRRTARREGMNTMRDDAWIKVLNGITTVEEVIRVTQPDEELKPV